MPTFRDIKRKARLTLHSRLGEPVIYVRDAGLPTEVQVSMTARLHLNFEQIGDLLRGGFAEREEISPTIVFLTGGSRPVEKAIVVTKDMGAWRVALVKPANDITISAEVVKLTDKQVGDLGWNSELQYMGLGTPEPIDPLGGSTCDWVKDEW